MTRERLWWLALQLGAIAGGIRAGVWMFEAVTT